MQMRILWFSVDRKTVTFDVQSAQRSQTGGKSTPYTGDGTSFADDTMTVTSGKDPSIMSTGTQTSMTSKSFVSLRPTEQVNRNPNPGEINVCTS